MGISWKISFLLFFFLLLLFLNANEARKHSLSDNVI